MIKQRKILILILIFSLLIGLNAVSYATEVTNKIELHKELEEGFKELNTQMNFDLSNCHMSDGAHKFIDDLIKYPQDGTSNYNELMIKGWNLSLRGDDLKVTTDYNSNEVKQRRLKSKLPNLTTVDDIFSYAHDFRNKPNFNVITEAPHLGQTAYNVVYDNAAVCGGFAMLTSDLLTNAGIKNEIVLGDLVHRDGTKEKHAWNRYYIDGETFDMDSFNNIRKVEKLVDGSKVSQVEANDELIFVENGTNNINYIAKENPDNTSLEFIEKIEVLDNQILDLYNDFQFNPDNTTSMHLDLLLDKRSILIEDLISESKDINLSEKLANTVKIEKIEESFKLQNDNKTIDTKKEIGSLLENKNTLNTSEKRQLKEMILNLRNEVAYDKYVDYMTTYNNAKANIPRDLKALEFDSIVSNSVIFNFDTPPVISNSRTRVPIRAIAEAFGAEVTWDGEDQTVGIIKDNKVIELPLNTNKVRVNGQEKTLDTITETINSRTYVPLRFISENLGLDVYWDNDTKTVLILE